MCELCDAALGRVVIEDICNDKTPAGAPVQTLVLRNLDTKKVAFLERNPDDKRVVKIGDTFEFYRDEQGNFAARALNTGGVN